MESVEAVRRRARHRLLGAVVLVLAGVAGFPLLFDTQPRPVAVDIPIEIPDRNKVAPLTPPPAAATAKVASAPVAKAPEKSPEKPPEKPAPVVAAPAAAAVAPEVSAPPKVAEKPTPVPEAKPEPKVAKAEPAARPKPRPDDGEKARALLEGKTANSAEAPGRYVVQVGAYADAEKAREARQKLESAGLKTYTHVAETKDGKRTRVRTGPYSSRAEADKAAEKIKGLDLPAAVLTL